MIAWEASMCAMEPRPAGTLPADLVLDRRRLLRSALLGAGALAGGSVLAACGSGSTTGTPAGGGTGTGAAGTSGGGAGNASGTLTFGSNQSDAKPKAAYQSMVQAFQAQAPGVDVRTNVVDHNTFQENINSYLQGRPDDVFTWFAGYRMNFFAKQGLASPIPEVWSSIGSQYSDALKQASTAEDGKQYFVPFDQYPWAVFYRKSVFAKHGYTPAKTMDEFTALAKQMQKDGFSAPLAFADKDGWPAMGTFDYLNMRTNGYDFHIGLMRGQNAWTDPKVKAVFDTWRGLLPYHQQGALGRTWQEGAQGLGKGDSGMMVFGMFIGQQFTGADLEDLDFFAFPSIDPRYGQDAVEAPIDGFMMSAKPKNPAAAEAFLTYLASPQAQQTYLKVDDSVIAANRTADTSGYTPLQKKAVEIIGGSKQISQFMDRDTRPDFASTVMIPSLQSFIRNPNDVDGLTRSIESQKKSIFTS